MISDELKKLLKEYANKRWGHIHEYEDGFLDCVDLLWPLVEALASIKSLREVNPNFNDSMHRKYMERLSIEALKDLEQKVRKIYAVLVKHFARDINDVRIELVESYDENFGPFEAEAFVREGLLGPFEVIAVTDRIATRTFKKENDESK